MKLMSSRIVMKPIFNLFVFAFLLLVCLAPRASAQQQRVRSQVRRIQLEQQRRNTRVIEESKRWQREHERRLLEWKSWMERQQKSSNP